MEALTIVLVVLACLVALAGWILSLAGISGTWLVLAAAVGADLAIDHDLDRVGWIGAIVFGLACVLAEVVEFASGLLGAKAFGGSRWAQVGAFVGTLAGGLVGSIAMPIVGTIIGAVAGGFVGSLLGEILYHQKAKDRGAAVKTGLKAGLGAMIARAVSIAVKASLSTLMVVWFVFVLVLGFAE